MASVEIVGPGHVFIEEDIVRNKFWVGIVNFSEGHRLIECCCLIYI